MHPTGSHVLEHATALRRLRWGLALRRLHRELAQEAAERSAARAGTDHDDRAPGARGEEGVLVFQRSVAEGSPRSEEGREEPPVPKRYY